MAASRVESGPIRDRLSVRISLSKVFYDILTNPGAGFTSHVIGAIACVTAPVLGTSDGRRGWLGRPARLCSAKSDAYFPLSLPHCP